MQPARNIAIIFAGGSGTRMSSQTFQPPQTFQALPKQFLEFKGKPIIIYTLEWFEHHEAITDIYVACLGEWIPYLKETLTRFGIRKVRGIVAGGNTGQESIYNALKAVDRQANADTVVLIHDGVRPLLDTDLITQNIKCARTHGSCITCVKATETFLIKNTDNSFENADNTTPLPLNDCTTSAYSFTIPAREQSLLARAPQTFYYKDILQAHEQARTEGRNDFIDSCTLMHHYGHPLSTVLCTPENIKITTPTDFHLFRAMQEARDNAQHNKPIV